MKILCLSPFNILTVTLNLKKWEFCVAQQNAEDFGPNGRNEKLNNIKKIFTFYSVCLTCLILVFSSKMFNLGFVYKPLLSFVRVHAPEISLCT